MAEPAPERSCRGVMVEPAAPLGIHGPRDYGDAWIPDAYREVMKIPRYVLDLPCP